MLAVDPVRSPGVILADDLTGSSEIALVLAENGLGDIALMWRGTDGIPVQRSVVVNLDTRDLPTDQARHRIETLLAERPEVRERLIFKKVDSTARRHLAVELAACLCYPEIDAALVALAAPNDKRRTVDSIHYADRVPIDQSPFARDLACPTAHLPTLLTHGTDLRCASVPLSAVHAGKDATARAIEAAIAAGNRVIAMDCVTAEDLRVIADAAIAMPRRVLPVGSAALFRQIVAAGRAVGRDGNTLPVLVVCGSLHPHSRGQVDRLLEATTLVLETGDPVPSFQGHPEQEAMIGHAISAHLAAGRSVVFATPPDLSRGGDLDTIGPRIADWTGRIVRSALEEIRVAGVVAMGGAIAAEVIRALGGTGLRVRDRLTPVVPVLELVGGPFAGLTMITKGGGVGTEDVLIDAVARLQRNGFASTEGNEASAEPPPRNIKESQPMTTKTETRPLIGLTIGDPSGIGPEITVKSLADATVYDECRPLVIGDEDIVRKACAICGMDSEIHVVATPDLGTYRPGVIDVLDIHAMDSDKLVYGKVSRDAGAAALAYIDRSIDLALEGAIHGVATAPIHKEAIHLAGCPHPGHTDIFGVRTKSETFTSMLAVGAFRVLHATLHCSLAEVSKSLTRERVLKIVTLAHSAVKDLGIANPRVAVAGVNPHASDGGLFGDEEARIIIPAIEDARRAGIDASGPIPPDSLFMRLRGGAWDVAVAMYHDQGHIPTKMMGWFWDEGKQTWTDLSGVGVTVGLPIVRTNPDHGTAFEIAGKGIANPQAMREAIQVAAQTAKGRGLI